MAIPYSYVARNLWKRRLTTALTAGGLALVVFVFAAVLMLDAGLKRTLVTTGEFDNVVAIRKGSETEIQSGVTRLQANVIGAHPAVAPGPDGLPFISKESVVLISLHKLGAARPSNVVIRGVSPNGLALRPQVRIVAGRLFVPGSTEIVVGRSIADGFENTRIGERLRFAHSRARPPTTTLPPEARASAPMGWSYSWISRKPCRSGRRRGEPLFATYHLHTGSASASVPLPPRRP